MKKPFVLSFALAFLTLSSFAQNFQPASIITADGSKLEGELNYQNWKQNPETVQFRKDAGAEVVSYGVTDLRSFEVSGDKYVSSVVEVDERTEDAKYISTNPAIISHPDTVFLRALVLGAKSLYHYYDKVDHFYIQRDGNFELRLEISSE